MLAELLSSIGLPDDQFAATCVLIDKLDKLPEDEVRKSLVEVGLKEEAVAKLLLTLKLSDFSALEAAMGSESAALSDLRRLFTLAEAYGVHLPVSQSPCKCSVTQTPTRPLLRTRSLDRWVQGDGVGGPHTVLSPAAE